MFKGRSLYVLIIIISLYKRNAQSSFSGFCWWKTVRFLSTEPHPIGFVHFVGEFYRDHHRSGWFVSQRRTLPLPRLTFGSTAPDIPSQFTPVARRMLRQPQEQRRQQGGPFLIHCSASFLDVGSQLVGGSSRQLDVLNQVFYICIPINIYI